MGTSRPKIATSKQFLSIPRAFVLVVGALLALTATSCSQAPDGGADGSQAAAAAASGDAQRASVQDICARFTAMALSSDAEVDRGPADARGRAASTFGTSELAAMLAGEGRDQSWPTLADHKAHIQIVTEPVGDDPPPVQANQASAGVLATRTAIGADGWKQVLPGVVAYCSLIPQDGSWKVAAVTFSDADQSGAGG